MVVTLTPEQMIELAHYVDQFMDRAEGASVTDVQRHFGAADLELKINIDGKVEYELTFTDDQIALEFKLTWL